jgi:hypothetical protein
MRYEGPMARLALPVGFAAGATALAPAQRQLPELQVLRRSVISNFTRQYVLLQLVALRCCCCWRAQLALTAYAV